MNCVYTLYITMLMGFEPTQVKPNGFQIRLLNHSDTTSKMLDTGLEPVTFGS